MKRRSHEQEEDNRPDRELSLRGEELIELMQCVLRRGERFRFRAAGLSMSPLIKDGDVLTLRGVEHRPLRLGDVVAFIHPALGKLIVHRVVAKSGGACIVRGDNTLQADGVMDDRDVLGVVTRIERRGQRVSFGLGRERQLIAFLSGRGHWYRLLCLARRISRLCSGHP